MNRRSFFKALPITVGAVGVWACLRGETTGEVYLTQEQLDEFWETRLSTAHGGPLAEEMWLRGWKYWHSWPT